MGASLLSLELVAPPHLSLATESLRRETTAEEKLNNLFGNNKVDAVAHQKNVGIEGSKRKSRADGVNALALGGSTLEEGLDAQLMRLVYGLCFQVVNDHTTRMMIDSRWSRAMAAVAERAAAPLPSGDRPLVYVLGLGGALPALVAARAGAKVVWVERVARFAECARRLAARNGLQERVQVRRVKQWHELKLDTQPGHTVITEEVCAWLSIRAPSLLGIVSLSDV